MSATAEKIDVEALMASIRAQVKRELGTRGDSPSSGVRYFKPKDSPRGGDDGADTPLLYSEDLNYLNAHWHDWNVTGEIKSHRRFLGPIIRRVKRFIIDAVWELLLKEYTMRERQYQMRSVRFLNEVARYVDKRDKEIFWQLVSKIDNEVAAVNGRTDRLFDQALSTIHQVESQLERGSPTKT